MVSRAHAQIALLDNMGYIYIPICSIVKIFDYIYIYIRVYIYIHLGQEEVYFYGHQEFCATHC